MALALAVLLIFQAPGTPPGYRIARSFPVPRAGAQAGERVELLEDERLTDSVLALIGQDAWLFPGENCSPLCAALAKDSVRDARVRLVDVSGRELTSFAPKAAIATVSEQYLRSDSRPTYFVTYSAGGAYSHTRTQPVEVHGTNWELSLPELDSSVRSGWRLAPTGSHGQDILVVESQVGSAQGDFVTTLTRYHFASGHWNTSHRTRPGYWEAGADFPSRSEFP